MGLTLPSVGGLRHNTGWEATQGSDGLVSVDGVLATQK